MTTRGKTAARRDSRDARIIGIFKLDKNKFATVSEKARCRADVDEQVLFFVTDNSDRANRFGKAATFAREETAGLLLRLILHEILGIIILMSSYMKARLVFR